MHKTNHNKSNQFKSVLLAGVAACAFASSTAYAQDSTSAPTSESATISSHEVSYKLEVGTIDAVGSNVDADTIRRVISGELKENANALANLTAQSIFIPEIKLIFSVDVNGTATDNEFVFKNISLSNVENGVAQTASMESMTGSMPPNKAADMDVPFTMEFGQSTITQFNLGAMLNAYGLITPRSDEMVQVYQDYVVAGGKMNIGPVACDIGKYRAGAYSARAMKVSYPELMALASELEASGEPNPEQVVKLVDFYADLLYSFETEPVVFDGIECAGEEDGNAFKFTLGETTMGAMGNGIYPAISVNDLKVSVTGKDAGEVSLGNFTFKEIDFNPTVEAYNQIEDITKVDEKWMEENIRMFIPSFGGLSLSDVSVDVPDDSSGERVQASLESFDISLGNYVNGIPTQIGLSAKGAQADLPANSKEEGVQQLLDMGIERINAGYELDLSWDEAASTIEIAKLLIEAEQLGFVDVSGYLVGASEQLFAADPQMMMMAAMGLGIAELNVSMDNEGFLDIALAQAAAEQGAPVEAFQTQLSAMANGMIVGLLGGVDQAVDLGGAVSSFVGGEAKSVDISIKAKSESGVGLPQIMALQSDPTQVFEYVDIESSAK